METWLISAWSGDISPSILRNENSAREASKPNIPCVPPKVYRIAMECLAIFGSKIGALHTRKSGDRLW